MNGMIARHMVGLATGVSLIAAPALALGPTTTSPTTTPVMAANGGSGGSGGALGGIFGCSADGGKQTTGAVIGGVLGGLLGNRVAGRGSRTLGTILGGVVGAAAGSALGCKLQKNDRAKAEKAMEDALAKGEDQSWQSAETGASGTVAVADAAAANTGLSGISFAKGVEPAGGYVKVGQAYVTKGAANVRSAPNLQGTVLGQLPAGTRVWVPASVQGAPWYLISQDGEGKGYVSNALMTKAATSVATNGCKTVTQTVDVPGEGPASETFQACKGADGQWVMTRV
jgi:surface antigen